MPAPLGPLLGLALGAAFAWVFGDGGGRGKTALAVAPLTLVTLFGLLVLAPAAAYFLAFEPDWAYAYLVDASRRLGVLHALVLLSDVASVPLGFTLALSSSRGPMFSVLVRLIGAPLLAAAVFVVVLFPRLSVQATYTQFHGDFGTRAVAGGPLGYALIWSTLVLAGAAAWTAHSLRRMR
ncbi:MAG TPA: hypothetical protein VG937_03090 [Polyangiaceae bacterium]|nr:hypothetical protein [Polyangiaceae bacterium]